MLIEASDGTITFSLQCDTKIMKQECTASDAARGNYIGGSDGSKSTP